MRIYIQIVLLMALPFTLLAQVERHSLKFNDLSNRWDEAIPLGNGMIGALIWENEGKTRFSLDRADLWDMRPMRGLHRKEFTYQWVFDQFKANNYALVQQYFDEPYGREAAPTKIPGGALEFNTPDSPLEFIDLSLKDALCTAAWENGMSMKTFIHASLPVGWFIFDGVDTNFKPIIVPPRYEGDVRSSGNTVEGDDLSRLGYKQGQVTNEPGFICYTQEGWNGFTYEIALKWERKGKTIVGVWSITSNHQKNGLAASKIVQEQISNGFGNALSTHIRWWKNFWSKSSIVIPDKAVEKQWYLEMYKFGSASRENTPPISLQAVWTADNGRIPPWKGDYHHDLNTELSYWPTYSSNHLSEGKAYLNHLIQNKENYRRFTKLYYEVDGLAIPGVTTLDGSEMGGWIQYALSPTVAGWVGQHFYLHWRYSLDTTFLREEAYPWFKEVATFFTNITKRDVNGKRQLPLSSSPEYSNNDKSAWFTQNSNFDLAIMKYTFQKAAELARELGKKEEAMEFEKTESEFDEFDSTPDGLSIAPGIPYKESHRHFSHALAIHPLGLINWHDSPESKEVINNTIRQLDKVGPDYWCGYSYSWMANLKARAKDGEGALEALRIFAKAFCLRNSFHVNGDQLNAGYSKLTYRPFTLEGNFAFAAGLQEMLIQSHNGFVELLPAIPDNWNSIIFNNLRVEGAFLVSLIKNGKDVRIKISSEKGGKLKLKSPFETFKVPNRSGIKELQSNGGFIFIEFNKGGTITLLNK